MPARAYRRIAAAWINLPLRAKGLVVVAIPVFTLLMTAIAFSFVERWAHEVEDIRYHHAGMQIQLQQLLSYTSEAQSATIAYAFAPGQAVLQRQQEAGEAVRTTIRELEAMPGHSPEHRQWIQQTADQVDDELQALAAWVELTRNRAAPEPAVASVQIPERRLAMQQLRQLIGGMLDAEEQRLVAAGDRVDQTRHLTLNLVAASTLLGVLGGLAAALLFLSGVVRRVQHLEENARRLARGEPLLPFPSGRDEIGRLSQVAADTAVRLRERDNALRETGNRLQGERDLQTALLYTLGALVVVLDRTGRIIRFNRACEQLTGLKADAVLGRLLWEIPFSAIPPDVLRTQFGNLLTVKLPYHGEHAVMARSSEERLIAWSITALLDEARQPEHLICTGIDITDRRQAEASLRESEERYRELVEMSPDAIVVHAGGTVLYANTAALRVVGASKATDVVGRPLLPFVHPDSRPLVIERMARMVADGVGVPKAEERLLRLDGSVVDVEAAGVPAVFQGQAAIQVVMHDISERKRAEAENARLFQENERRVDALASLYSAAWQVAQSLDPRELAAKVCQVLVEQRGLQGAWLGRADPDGVVRVIHAENVPLGYFDQHEIRWDDSPRGKGPVGRALRRGEPQTAQDIAGDASLGPWQEPLLSLGVHGAAALPLVSRNAVFGTLTVYCQRPGFFTPEMVDYLQAYANLAAAAMTNARLFDEAQRLYADLQQSNANLIAAYDRSLQGWSRALDLRDHDTEGHTERVTEYAARLALAAGVPEADMVHLRRGALLHDIGKIGIPDHVLLKPGPLTSEEWVVMKQHPEMAYEWLAPIEFLRPALDIPYCHHERWDGSGYPRGLSGEAIPLLARIFAVVDVWDALRSERPYRSAWTDDAAREYIATGAGSQFDPHIVQVFLHMNW